jgi:omega-hydroxy-beta-dihydromenaquinone-9 sulfotransferase
MYLNKRALKELKRTLFKKPTLGRLATTATLVVPNYTGFRQAVSVLRRLDDVLYPGYREQRIERPVFIFANPRSGTTLTHRLMSMDDAEFTTVKLYQTILTSITATKAIEGLIGLSDTRVGARLRQIYDWLNAPFAKRWQGVHELSLSQPEEDECTFLFALQSPTAALLLPFIDDLEQQIWLDRQDPKEREAFLDDYESTIKRHVYAAGGKRFLNKNVFFATRIQAMYQKFPDATFVYLIRNPYDSLPSFLNMFYRGWVSHSPNIPPDGEEIEALKQLGYEYYRYALRCREQIPSKQFLVIRYEDLVADPKATILRLYERLGMEVSEDFEAKLDEAMVAHREWDNPRDYTLEYFGLSREEVHEELAEVFAEFGYDERPAHRAQAAEQVEAAE